MGLAGYYRRFIKYFSSIAKPITQLTQKNAPCIWTEACEDSFIELKKRLTSALVLIIHSGKSNAAADALSRKDAQKEDQGIQKSVEMVKSGHQSEYKVSADDILYVNNRLVVQNVSDLKQLILKEAHCSKYSIHQGGRKMYNDLKNHYWWKHMKSDVTEYVSRCLNCQQVKAERKKPDGLLQSLPIPE
ncbi:uncharacterized protein [Henckelia pumila]|uniref:uncharacterized protein n=1 Tax=Henckelia pumila TaxID=405737 RepID=UPI003C6E47ED